MQKRSFCHLLFQITLIFVFLSNNRLVDLGYAAEGGGTNTTILITGKVYDAETNAPLAGANVFVPNTTLGTTSNSEGEFVMEASLEVASVVFSYIGYHVQAVEFTANSEPLEVKLKPSSVDLQPVVISAGRMIQPRTEAPIAIATVTEAMMSELKATRLYEAVNKVAGVYMVDIGNEQNTVAVRQPITYKAFFLYLEDGIPIRPTGVFNHNALYELNMSGINRFEVIKGPSSSIYGSNAIGGAMNFFTPDPTQRKTGKISVRGNDNGYRRSDFTGSTTVGNLGLYVGGYVARQRDGWRQHSDFDKVSITARADYAINSRTKLISTLSTNHLDTDMTGSLDSTAFFGQDYSSQQTFTYRKVHATRVRTTLSQIWSDRQQTDFTLFFRDNTTLQNPSYRVKRNFSNPTEATGEENDNSFQSYGVNLQHRQHFSLKSASLLSGVTVDYTPATYVANFISIDRDPTSGTYTGFASHDSVLTRYDVDLFNVAAYSQFEIKPSERLKLVAGLRFDHIGYDYDNHLPLEAFSGAPDEKTSFDRVSPKIGITYDLKVGKGLYANFSQGFQPPEVGELYRGVKVPTLKPAHFNNIEAGAWFALLQGKLYLEASVYQMDGIDEIIGVRLDDGSSANANAGETRHRGIEYAITYSPVKSIEFSFNGTNAKHEFRDYIESGADYSGNEMNGAPSWIANADITFRPPFLRGARINFEWQHVDSFFLDPTNTQTYSGYDIFNIRLGYRFGAVELWTNMLNTTDELFATTASKSRWGKSYTPGDPRNVSVGISLSR